GPRRFRGTPGSYGVAPRFRAGLIPRGVASRSILDKSLGPLSIGLWIIAAEHGLPARHRVEHRRLKCGAIHPTEASQRVERQQRNRAGWTAENSFRIICVEVVTHYPEQQVFG